MQMVFHLQQHSRQGAAFPDFPNRFSSCFSSTTSTVFFSNLRVGRQNPSEIGIDPRSMAKAKMRVKPAQIFMPFLMMLNGQMIVFLFFQTTYIGTLKEIEIIHRLFLVIAMYFTVQPVQASSMNHQTSYVASWLGRKTRYMQQVAVHQKQPIYYLNFLRYSHLVVFT